jgi:hypothetical protein
MCDALTREQLQFASNRWQGFMRELGGGDGCHREQESWLCDLAIFGPTAYSFFSEVQAELIAANGAASEPMTVAPWKHAPDRIISAATAHECAGILISLFYREVFTELPRFRNLKEEVRPWVAANSQALLDRLDRLSKATDYSQLLALAAKVEIERVHAWGAATAAAAVTGGPKKRRATRPGGAPVKIVGALELHHGFDGDSCLVIEPIGVNDLADKADVAAGSVTAFFNRRLGDDDGKNGHDRYVALCNLGAPSLIGTLRKLSAEPIAAGSNRSAVQHQD